MPATQVGKGTIHIDLKTVHQAPGTPALSALSQEVNVAGTVTTSAGTPPQGVVQHPTSTPIDLSAPPQAVVQHKTAAEVAAEAEALKTAAAQLQIDAANVQG
jgi:hypothetical protein